MPQFSMILSGNLGFIWQPPQKMYFTKIKRLKSLDTERMFEYYMD